MLLVYPFGAITFSQGCVLLCKGAHRNKQRAAMRWSILSTTSVRAKRKSGIQKWGEELGVIGFFKSSLGRCNIHVRLLSCCNLICTKL